MIDYKSFDDPIVDDPYDFGRIAAANSLSDIYAMGGKPLFALNIVAFPVDDLPLNVLTDILRGGSDIALEAGIPILGGHSIKDKEPKYGLVVTGTPFKDPIKNSTAQSGDIIVLTKPLGLGIVSTAIKRDIADKKMIDEAVDIMIYLNKDASESMMSVGVNACTDITGYGLLGHLLEMCKGSKLSANINFDSIQFMTGAKKLAKEGVVPGGTKKNYDFIKDDIIFSNNLGISEKYLLADAQTSGGLLISVSKEKLDELKSKLSTSKYGCMEIGSFEDLDSNYHIKVS